MAVDLRFFRPLDTSHPVDLVFGDEGGPPDDSASLTFAITMSPPATLIVLKDVQAVSFAIAMAKPSMFVQLGFDNAVPRVLSKIVSTPWQEATRRPRYTDMPWHQATRRHREVGDNWTEATPVRAEKRTPWQQMSRLARRTSARWQEGTPLPAQPTAAPWQERDQRIRPHITARWQEGTPLSTQPTTAPWQERGRDARPIFTTVWQEGTLRLLPFEAPWGQGTPVPVGLTAPWQEGRKPGPGRTVVTPPEPPVHEPCYTPPHGLAVDIYFDTPMEDTNDIFFICKKSVGPPATVIVPVRRVYMIVNEATLTRADDGTLIPTYGMSLSLDVDSWTWSFSASVPGVALPAVEPESDGTPVEVLASINGVTYRFLIESIQRDRTFGSSKLSLAGRGRTALLDSPYAPSLSFYNDTGRTAQQLMADVLTDGGVSMGWDVTWNLDDWLVPAGAFSQTGSYMSALNAIAAAAGAYIQPHNTDEAFSVNLRYPHKPWEWSGETPDYELPSAVTTRESIGWVEKPRYNRVWVQGEGKGVRGRVTRFGTAGDLLAPMVTDPLITAAAAARQRGLSILADTGRIATVGLRLPVLEETGIIPPGKLVRYVDGSTVRLGITRSVNVDVAMPAIWQNLTVETHA